MLSMFLGSNVNPRIRKEFAEKFNYGEFNENDTTLIPYLEKINVWKLYGYLTTDVIEKWQELFDTICSDPENQTIWEENPIFYILFFYEGQQVVYWKYTIQSKQLEMYLGTCYDANYFISETLPISFPIEEEINNVFHLAPKNTDDMWQELEEAYDNRCWKIDYKRVWYNIFQNEYLFKRVKLNNLVSQMTQRLFLGNY